MTGRTVERDKPMAQDEYHIVVVAIIRNAEGKYLISKRAAKKHFPNMWEFMGGSVLAGENSLSGALREAKEVLGVEVDRNKAILFKTGIRQYRSFPDFNDIWLFSFDYDINDIVLQEGETIDAMWATDDEIRKMIKNKEFVEYNELPFIDELFNSYT